MTYRIADEVAPGIPAEPGVKPPWHPLGIFTLLVFLPTFVPFGAVFGALNSARLGVPSRRVIWLAMGVLVLAVPFGLAVAGATPYLVNTAALMTRLGYAFALLTTQRPLFDTYIERGGRSAPAWPLWATGALALLIGYAIASIAPGNINQNAASSSQGKPPKLGLPR